MTKGVSPLLGYNTNVRHKGRVFHIQTEDSGVHHPHIITHLFADGGRIVSSKKTTYAEHVGKDDYQAIVKKLMQDQHKAMFIALRDGAFDGELGDLPEGGSGAVQVPPAVQSAADPGATRVPAGAAAPDARTPRYAPTQPAGVAKPPSFAKELVSDKSLDEVILSYLAEDADD